MPPIERWSERRPTSAIQQNTEKRVTQIPERVLVADLFVNLPHKLTEYAGYTEQYHQTRRNTILRTLTGSDSAAINLNMRVRLGGLQ